MKGDCLITVATGPMSESDADRAGLVPTHAYALLDIRKVLVGYAAFSLLLLCWVCYLRAHKFSTVVRIEDIVDIKNKYFKQNINDYWESQSLQCNSGLPRTSPGNGRVKDLDQEPLHFKSRALIVNSWTVALLSRLKNVYTLIKLHKVSAKIILNLAWFFTTAFSKCFSISWRYRPVYQNVVGVYFQHVFLIPLGTSSASTQKPLESFKMEGMQPFCHILYFKNPSFWFRIYKL